jgi:hypothetical protein
MYFLGNSLKNFTTKKVLNSTNYHGREKYNSREKYRYSVRTFHGKLRHFKSSFLTNKSYGIEGEYINDTLEKENIKIFILRCRKSPFL